MLPALRYAPQRLSSYHTSWGSTNRPSNMEPNEQIFDLYDPSQSQIVPTSSTTTQGVQYSTSLGPSDPSSLQYQYGSQTYPPAYGYPVTTYADMPALPGVTDIPEHQLPETERERSKRRRQEQNRRSQKEFRARKEKRIKELQQELEETQKNFRTLSEEAGELRTSREGLEAEIHRLMEENKRLRSSIESSPASDVAWLAGHDELGASSSSNATNNSGSLRR